jgi:hypothetical protein
MIREQAGERRARNRTQIEQIARKQIALTPRRTPNMTLATPDGRNSNVEFQAIRCQIHAGVQWNFRAGG